MTDELGSSARALLDAAREGMSPDAAAIQRMRSKIDLAVGGAAVGGAAAGLSLAAKLGIVAVVAAVATGGYLFATRDRAPAPRPVVQMTAPAPSQVPAPPPPAPVQITAIEQPAPTPKPVAPIKTTKPAAKPPTEHVLPPEDMTPKRKPIDLAREVELVDRAMAALRRGDPREALVALRTYASETAGSGQLAEDAAAIEIEALCKLGDSSVPTKLASFDKRWPESAQRSRLTTRCP